MDGPVKGRCNEWNVVQSKSVFTMIESIVWNQVSFCDQVDFADN